MNPVWQVRSRQIASSLKFWMALVGYNPRERFWSQIVYLAYVGVFFSIWGFGVLALLADQGAQILSTFQELPPSLVSMRILTVVLLVDAILRGYRSGRESPFIFSDDDADLICQTPVDRRQVALAWMLGDWILPTIPFLSLAVVLKFATIQLTEAGGVQWSHLFDYWLAGMRLASLVLFLHLTFSSLTYTLGALRLRGDRDKPWLRLIPVCFALLFLSLAVSSRAGLEISLWPVQFLLKAGFNEASWIAGFGIAILLAFGGLLGLYLSSSRLNLSRAAQESRYRWAFQQVSWLGNTQLSQQMSLYKHLGSGHSTTLIAGREGAWSLIWKQWVMALRMVRIGKLIAWLGVLLTCLGMMVPLDWGAQLWAFIIWVLLVGQRVTEPMRTDLEQWTITRQLPFRARDAVLAEIAGPVLLATMLGWLAYGLGVWAGQTLQIDFVPLLFPAVLCIAFIATYDVLRQCRCSDLSAGNVPEMGFGGLLAGALVAALPLVLVPMISSQSNQVWMSFFVNAVGFGISLTIAFGLWKLTASQYRNIK